MNSLVERIKVYIKDLELDFSDLFLAIGFLFSVPFYAFAWKFMVTTDPSQVFFKPWMMISCFAITAICWAIYFYLEIKNKRIGNRIFLFTYIFFVVLSLIVVLVQPKYSSVMVEAKHVNDVSIAHYPGISVGDMVQVDTVISDTHRLFFSFATIVITTVFYIVLFILPKRIKNTNFLILVGVIIFIFLFVLSVYSYITESQKYIPFIKALFKGDVEEIYKNSMSSFVVQRVPYGACMMLGTMFALVLHALTNKKYWLIPLAYCYINMIFSYCKTSLALSFFAMAFYFAMRLFATYKDHKKRNKIIGIIYASIVGVVLLVVAISLISQGKFAPLVYKIFTSFTDSRTIRTRTYVWANINQRLSGGWWIIGRGFGTHNYMLYPMNLVNGDDVCPSHSTYYAVLGAGGVISLIGFLASYIYYGYVFVKCFKVDKYKAIGLSIGVLAFLLYSFTEGVNYLIMVFMFPLILYYHLIQRGIINKEVDAQ